VWSWLSSFHQVMTAAMSVGTLGGLPLFQKLLVKSICSRPNLDDRAYPFPLDEIECLVNAKPDMIESASFILYCTHSPGSEEY
jgi:hypothetical protein